MSDPDWHLWRAFLAVLQRGSLSAAARDLGLTQPTLGRQIAALEMALSTTLFTRSTDGLRPPERARDLAPHAEAMAAAAAALVRAGSGGRGEVSGSVRLAASEFLGGAVLPPMLAAFRVSHPQVDIELSLSDRVEDLLRRDADLAVRNVAPTQGGLVARRIGAVPIRFYAHRSYVARYGVPETLPALAGHTLIGQEDHVRQIRPRLGLDLRLGLRCDNALGLLAALRAGYGIGYCQEGVARHEPDLVPVLPDLVLVEIGIWLVMHEDLRRTQRIRVLFDHLVAELTAYARPRDA
ncbi:LysR family transcriptional regulator [Methylorubrum zatmanii]|uniref:LysR family transcriptional regulator n=1 Tax=Methylorubrum zatmanii TaxID=29429 RepID=A0ABW1WWD7_9HYPH|nr:LysR family transcriptional regulator [Methylorubrum zatmanii]MBD8906239.1 LysR family transcriptional regulator [Methylorubrum zatmanii]